MEHKQFYWTVGAEIPRFGITQPRDTDSLKNALLFLQCVFRFSAISISNQSALRLIQFVFVLPLRVMSQGLHDRSTHHFLPYREITIISLS